MLPVAQHPEPLELRLLPGDLLRRVRAAQLQRFLDRQVLAVRLLDLHLDRHAVAVPARDVGRIESRHRPALDDQVLQDLVERMPDVDVGVGVGRTVMQHEARSSRAGLPNGLVDLVLLPLADPARLALREIAAHRKRRVGQIERRLVIGLRIVGHAGVVGGSIVRIGKDLQRVASLATGTAPAKNARASATSPRMRRARMSRSGNRSSSRSLCTNSTATRRP